MSYDPDKHHRHAMRLRGWNYSWSGAYFITICTAHRTSLFGDITDGEMHLNDFGQIVDEEWLRSSAIRQEIVLDQYVIMPNHFHAIVFIYRQSDDSDGKGGRPSAPTFREEEANNPQIPAGPRPRSLSTLVRGFKSATKLRINEVRQSPGLVVWQRSFYDHIIRNDTALQRIREYVANNPALWGQDRYFSG